MGLLRVNSAMVDHRRVMQLRGSQILAAMVVLGSALPVCTQTSGNRATAPCNVLQPYTAEFKMTRVQTLADGTTITNEVKRVKARDSQGRTMITTTESPFGSGQPALTYVTVNDPAEGTQTNWDSRSRRATITKLPPADQRHGCWRSDSGHFNMNYGDAPSRAKAQPGGGSGTGSVAGGVLVWRPVRPKFTREDLGTTTIMGVEVRGTRFTTTTPAGAIGNDRPLVSTTETWVAPSLGIPLRQVQINPQSGKMTTELQNLDLSEPVKATFQPPEGYDVVTEELHQVPCQSVP